MKIAEALHRKRPSEVYVGGVLLYFLFFLNAAELFAIQTRIDEMLSMNKSAVYALIRGVGDDYLRHYQAEFLCWVLSFIYTCVVLLKARRISNWLWSDNHFPPNVAGK